MPQRPPPPAESDSRPAVALFRSPLFNASETFVRAHAEGLGRYRPILVGLERKGDFPGFPAERMMLPQSGAERLAIRLAGRWGQLGRRIAAERPAIVHAHFGTDGLLALPLADSLGVPLVTTLHGYDVALSRPRLFGSGRLSWMRYALERRRLIEQGALFLAVSDAVRDRAVARGFPEARTRTLPLGVDLERFRPPDAPREPGLILHVGRLVEKKGTRILLEAMAEVRRAHPRSRLVIVGEGPERTKLERRSAALGLGDAVRFEAALPPEAVAEWMQHAALLAAPSVTARDGDSEGLPTVVVEAASAGLPAIGSDHSGIPEAIADGETGFVVPERDAEGLAARITQLLGDEALRDRMGAAARRLAEERFDAARQIRALEQIYDELAAAA